MLPLHGREQVRTAALVAKWEPVWRERRSSGPSRLGSAVSSSVVGSVVCSSGIGPDFVRMGPV